MSNPALHVGRPRYGGRSFNAASGLALSGGLGQPRRLVVLMGAAARRPRLAAALLVVLVGTRSERVPVSTSPAGMMLRDYFDDRFLKVIPRNRLCRGLLPLPERHSDYVRGRRRQALRTNLRRAAAAGIRCTAATSPEYALHAADSVLRDRRAQLSEADRANLARTWPELFGRRGVTLLVAESREGRPLAVMAAVIDHTLCLISLAIASSHEARWALHDHLVRLLIERGVRYLVVEGDGPLGALGFPAEVHHYQHLLGYQLRHVVPQPTASLRLRTAAPEPRSNPESSCPLPAAAGAGGANRARSSVA